MVEGKKADSFLGFLSKNWKGFSWACDSVGEEGAVDSLENSFQFLFDGFIENIMIGDIGPKDLGEIVVSHFFLGVFVLLIADWYASVG